LVINTDLTDGKISHLNGSNVAIVAQTVNENMTNGLRDDSEEFREFNDAGNGNDFETEPSSSASKQSNPKVSISISFDSIRNSKGWNNFLRMTEDKFTYPNLI
jgi:hypothetical protein